MKNIETAIIKSNMEIFEYIRNNLKKEDYLYTNQIGFGGDNSLKIDIIFENIL